MPQAADHGPAVNIPEEPVAGARDPIAAGWEALADGAWAEAGERFAAALATRETAEALEGASWAAWWQHDEQATFEARERAYRLYRTRGDRRGAARMATWLGTDSVDFRGDLAVGQGWLARARRLLVDLEPGPEHGWLDVHEAEKRLLVNDAVRARSGSARARRGSDGRQG